MVAGLMAATSAPPRRVAVFGGSGFIGSRVCRTLVANGCTVLSVSRSGDQTSTPFGKSLRWAVGEPWLEEVEWIEADAAAGTALDARIGGVEGVVSCIGSKDVLSPSSNSYSGNKWSEESKADYSRNFDPNERAVGAAVAAGAARFVLVDVASDAEIAYGGTRPGLYEGKRAAADAARAAFGDGATCIGPHSVVSGPQGDLKMRALDSSWARGLIAANRAIGNVGYRGEDYATRCALTPPCGADDLALAVAAAVLGAVEVEPSERFVFGAGGVEVRTRGRHVDGSAAIQALARRAQAAGLVSSRE